MRHPTARRLLITADSGGSNGSRLRLWKTQLALLAAETGLEITVVHLPPVISKWQSHRHAVPGDDPRAAGPACSTSASAGLIGAVHAQTGLTVEARLDLASYPKGIKISDKDMAVFYTVLATPRAKTTRPNRGK